MALNCPAQRFPRNTDRLLCAGPLQLLPLPSPSVFHHMSPQGSHSKHLHLVHVSASHQGGQMRLIFTSLPQNITMITYFTSCASFPTGLPALSSSNQSCNTRSSCSHLLLFVLVYVSSGLPDVERLTRKLDAGRGFGLADLCALYRASARVPLVCQVLIHYGGQYFLTARLPLVRPCLHISSSRIWFCAPPHMQALHLKVVAQVCLPYVILPVAESSLVLQGTVAVCPAAHTMHHTCCAPYVTSAPPVCSAVCVPACM